MDATRVPIFFVCLFTSAVMCSEGNRKILETLVGDGELDQKTAGQVWCHCKKESEDCIEAVHNLDFCLRHGEIMSNIKINSDALLPKKGQLQKTITDLPPQVKQTFLTAIGDLPPQVKQTLITAIDDLPPQVKQILSGGISNLPPKVKQTLSAKIVDLPPQVKQTLSAAIAGLPPQAKDAFSAAIADLSPQAKQTLLAPAFSPSSIPLPPAKAPSTQAKQTLFVPAISPSSTPMPPAEAPSSIPMAPAKAPSPQEKHTLLAPAITPSAILMPPAKAPSSIPKPPAKALSPQAKQTLLAPAISPSSAPMPPAKAPEPSLPQNLSVSPPPPHFAPNPPQHYGDSHPNAPQNRSNFQKYIITAIVSTSAGLLVLAAVPCFCCRKGNIKTFGSGDGQIGPLQNSHGAGSSSNKDFTLSSTNSLSIKNNAASLVQAQSSEATGGASGTNNDLPLPPGTKAPPPPGSPPPPPKPPPPRPPPTPKAGFPPPVPLAKPSPHGLIHHGNSSSGGGNDMTGESDGQKTKLKPLFWDKVLANPDHSMVWHEIKSGSFEVNEEMMENLFGYTPAEKLKNEHWKDSSSFDSPHQYIKIIDAKKSQNLAIILKALNVTTEEVCDAVKEGNQLPADLVRTLLKMAPTAEEELKLRLFSGDPSQLGPAERFLKVVIDIPFACRRLESLLFMSSLEEEVPATKESFETLEVACTELKNSRLFLKLLEAVLKTGNRMNDGTFHGDAQALKLDTLLKLSDVKGTDGRTTLLHFVVQEIIRSEGMRAARGARESQCTSSMKTEDLVDSSTHETYYCALGLQVVSGLNNDLENVRKAALIDGDNLRATISQLSQSLLETKDFLNDDMKSLDEDSRFRDTLANFVQRAEDEITWLVEEEKRIMGLVKETAEYFHGKERKDEGLRLFVIVRDFLIMLDKACKEVRNLATKPLTTAPRRGNTSSASTSSDSCQPTLPCVHRRLFPAIRDCQMHDSGSDDDSFSP